MTNNFLYPLEELFVCSVHIIHKLFLFLSSSCDIMDLIVLIVSRMIKHCWHLVPWQHSRWHLLIGMYCVDLRVHMVFKETLFDCQCYSFNKSPIFENRLLDSREAILYLLVVHYLIFLCYFGK